MGRPGRGHDPVRRRQPAQVRDASVASASQKTLEGEPRLLVRDGRILTKALDEEGVDVEDVRAAARGAGIARLDDVRLAVLETDGSISIIAMDDSVHPTTDTRSEI